MFDFLLGPNVMGFPAKRRVLERLNQALFIGRGRRRWRKDKRTVLVVAENDMMLDYIAPVWRIAAGFGGTIGYSLAPGNLTGRCRQLGLVPLSRRHARLRAFDVILMSNHMPARLDPFAARVRVPHGPAISKKAHLYDPKRLFWPDGRPVYSLILDVNSASANAAEKTFPSYRGRILAVGDLRTEQLVRATAKNDLRTEPPTIGVMSTWGKDGLLERHGDWLLPKVAALAETGRFRWVVTAHPNIWTRREGRDWRPQLMNLASTPGIRVVMQNEDWGDFLPTCSATITDHTSLANSFAATGRAILPVKVSQTAYQIGSFYDALQKVLNPIGPEDDLVTEISGLLSKGMPPAWATTVLPKHVPIVDGVEQRIQDALRPFLEPGQPRET